MTARIITLCLAALALTGCGSAVAACPTALPADVKAAPTSCVQRSIEADRRTYPAGVATTVHLTLTATVVAIPCQEELIGPCGQAPAELVGADGKPVWTPEVEAIPCPAPFTSGYAVGMTRTATVVTPALVLKAGPYTVRGRFFD